MHVNMHVCVHVYVPVCQNVCVCVYVQANDRPRDIESPSTDRVDCTKCLLHTMARRMLMLHAERAVLQMEEDRLTLDYTLCYKKQWIYTHTKNTKPSSETLESYMLKTQRTEVL